MSNPTGADDATKKRPRSTTPTNNSSGSKDEISSKKQQKKKKTQTDINDDYADEISSASSPELLPLLSSSLYRMTNGLPRRELNLIVSEAQACEDALEQELKLLRGALRIEKQEREKAKATITDDVATTSTTGNTLSDKSVTDKKAEEKEKVAEKSSQASTSTTAITTTTKSVTDGSHSSPNDNDNPTTCTIMTPMEVAAVDTMIDSEITPTDAHWTLSALLGRLRHELTTPLPPGSQLPAYREKAGLQQLVNSVGLSYSSSSTTSSSSKEKRTTSNATAPPPPAAEATISTTATMTDSTTADASSTTENSTDGKISGRSTPNINNNDDNTSNTLELPQYKRLTILLEHPEFVREQDNTDKLLAIWKKLSTHRSTLVFRRPVNPKEAPGYSDRIRFPIDLSLIRKLIVSKNIKNYHGILQRVHLIAHNCVKYNGRESDYALVTREFESVATEYIFTAVTSPVPVPSPLVVPMPPPLVAPTTTTTTTTTTTSSGSTDIEPKENTTKVSSAVESINTTHTV